MLSLINRVADALSSSPPRAHLDHFNLDSSPDSGALPSYERETFSALQLSDVLLLIFSHLDAQTLTASANLVCRRWRTVANDPCLWASRIDDCLLSKTYHRHHAAGLLQSPAQQHQNHTGSSDALNNSIGQCAHQQQPPHVQHQFVVDVQQDNDAIAAESPPRSQQYFQATQALLDSMLHRRSLSYCIRVISLPLLHHAVYCRNFLRNPNFVRNLNSDYTQLLRRGPSDMKTLEHRRSAWVGVFWPLLPSHDSKL